MQIRNQLLHGLTKWLGFKTRAEVEVVFLSSYHTAQIWRWDWYFKGSSLQLSSLSLSLDRVSFCHPGWSAVVWSQLTTAASTSWAQVILPPQPPKLLGLQACTTMPSLIFKFFVEIRSHYVTQAGLEILSSNDPPALASQSTGTNHCT